jgi:pepF/M3 family oligoendopeptidase
MNVTEPLNQKWDLDVLFPGGSASPAFAAFLDALTADVAAFRTRLTERQVPQTPADVADWSELFDTLQEIARRQRHAGAFIGCLNAQDMKDQQAKLLGGRLKQIGAAFASVLTLLDAQLLHMPDAAWAALLALEKCRPIAFNLAERRRRVQDKLGPELESLVNDLAVDGYHAWGEFYNTVVGRVDIPFTENGKTVLLSAGQAANKLNSGDRAVREAVWEKWEAAWADQAELIAPALNHQAGFRVNLYKHRGWESVLKEPLDTNRMTETTLNVMWETIDRNKAQVVKFLARKAKVMGLPGLAWHDVTAPLTKVTRQVTFEEAADTVVEQFGRFSPGMADFAAGAIKNRWVEAEDRPGKRPGAFCTSFPVTGASRVFMTFGGTVANISTLAHELGHAYHQSVMNDLPQMAQGYAMNVAETASTFAEMILADAAVKNAQSPAERIALLADKCEKAVTMFMNIHSRFIFETAFFDERKRGLVSVDRLNELMVNAQKQAFCDALMQYHPHFWASKLHFYSTAQPFYNFPYTFGFLFSSGIYARAAAEGPAFAGRYVDLLRDTGRMQVEDLAAKHLGVDLTKPEFWQSAIDLSLADIDLFLKETE